MRVLVAVRSRRAGVRRGLGWRMLSTGPVMTSDDETEAEPGRTFDLAGVRGSARRETIDDDQDKRICDLLLSEGVRESYILHSRDPAVMGWGCMNT